MSEEQTDFEIWWAKEGSKSPEKQLCKHKDSGESWCMTCMDGPCVESEYDWGSHCKAMCQIAWENGGFKAEINSMPSELVDPDEAERIGFQIIEHMMKRCGVQSEKDAHKMAMKLVTVFAAFLEKTTSDAAPIIQIFDAQGNPLNR